MNNRSLLAVVAILLVGIFAVVSINARNQGNILPEFSAISLSADDGGAQDTQTSSVQNN